MTDTKRMNEDFEYFCETMLGEKLSDWQKDVMHRLSKDGVAVTKMIARETVSGTSFDCVIVDDFYDDQTESYPAHIDFVTRLRSGIHTSSDPLALTNEAADRIEQLEAVLRKIACVCWPNPGCTRGEKCKEFIARIALERKDG